MSRTLDHAAPVTTVVDAPRFYAGFVEGTDAARLRERLRAYRDPDRPEVRGLRPDYRAALVAELVAALAIATPEVA